MNIDLAKLNYRFLQKPLLIGGKAMEYYGLRKAGTDIDLVLSLPDHERLRRQYADNIKDIWGDIGICQFEFEMWNQICRFNYEYLRQNAIEKESYLVAALDKLILLKAIAMHVDKYRQDLELLGKYAVDIQYGKRELP